MIDALRLLRRAPPGVTVLALTALAAAALVLVPARCEAQERVQFKGKRLAVVGPSSDKATLKFLTAQGESALVRYAGDLGVTLPEHLFKINIYGTEAEYARAEEVRTKGRFRSNLAFCYAEDAEVHMVFQPRTSRSSGAAAPGMLEELAMHELSHALQYKTVPNYVWQPEWLSEGYADLCAERALAGPAGSCIEKNPFLADFFLDVREALGMRKFVPLDRIFAEGLQSEDVHERQCRYGTCFALVRLLDAPADAERRKKFRGFMKEVMAMPAGEDLAPRANARFAELFGKRTKGGGFSLAGLERELVQSIRTAEVFPWHVIVRDLRAMADGSLISESFPAGSSLAIAVAEPLSQAARVKATFSITNGPGQQADIAFAYRGSTDYHKLAFCASGYITLLRFTGDWVVLNNLKVDPALIAPGVEHKIELAINGPRLDVSIDGNGYQFTLKDGVYGGGRYGIGAYDGRVIFKDVSGGPL